MRIALLCISMFCLIQGASSQTEASLHFHHACQRNAVGDTKSALAELDSSLSLKPGIDSAYCLRARLRFLEGDYKTAVKDLDKALHVNAACFEAWYLRGLSKAGLEDYPG